jgi:hypothetical protein
MNDDSAPSSTQVFANAIVEPRAGLITAASAYMSGHLAVSREPHISDRCGSLFCREVDRHMSGADARRALRFIRYFSSLTVLP